MSNAADKTNRYPSDFSATSLPYEDRALKFAAQFFGSELLPLLGITGKIRRIAPTEQIHLEMKSFMQDFNFEMEDGTWKHFEFESDPLTDDDLRRFRAYEAVASFYYKVEVETCVICTAKKRKLKKKLKQGRNLYRIRIIRLQDHNADQIWANLQQKRATARLDRADLIQLLLTPLMAGKSSVSCRIERSIQMLQKEQTLLDHEDIMRMESILYAFAAKFVTGTELEHIQEVLKMTLLGQMLVDSGRQEGLKEGLKEGLNQGEQRGILALIETCQEFGSTRAETLTRLEKKFSLSSEDAAKYLTMYWK